MSTTIRFDRRRLAALVLATALGAPLAAETTARAAEPTSDADALAALRERFRAGLDKYEAGNFAEAILVWDGIYRELGPDAGYRLAFNLGRAYEAAGDAQRAAEHYDAYLRQVGARRERGEALEAIVDKQAITARDRLADLVATRLGRIRVLAADRPVPVQIDRSEPRVAGFTIYATPGRTYEVKIGTDESTVTRVVTANAGEIVEIAPPPRAQAAPAQVARDASTLGPALTSLGERPIPQAIVWAAAGTALASVTLPVVMYGRAMSLRDAYDQATSRDDKVRLASDYDGARSTAYATLAVPAALGAVAGALALYGALGPRKRKVVVGAPGAPGALAGASVEAHF